MHRAGVFRVMLVVLVFALAVGALGYRHIDLRLVGARLQRGSEAVLGLRLGLDLQGGSHLVFQARGTSEIAVTFQEPEPESGSADTNTLRAQAVTKVLSGLGVSSPSVQVISDTVVSIKTASPLSSGADSAANETSPDATAIRLALERAFGPITIYQVSDADGGGAQIDVTFQNPLQVPKVSGRREQVRGVLDSLGMTDASIRIDSDTTMLITVTSLRPEEKDSDGSVTRVAEADTLKQALEEHIGPITSYNVTEIPANPTSQQMEGVLDIIERRVNPYGIAEPIIQLMNNNRVLVQLPGLQDVDEVKRLIGRTARLEFKERECQANVPVTANGSTFYPCDIPGNRVDKETGLTGEDLARAFPGTHPTTGLPIVNLQFNSRGTRIFGELTARLAQTLNTPTPDRFVIFLDNEEIVAPVANQAILSGSAFIEGPDFTPERVRTIAIQLESGRLPVPLELVQELDIDATLGQSSLEKSLTAGIVGLGLVMLFMVVYYKAPGVVASMSLVIYAAMVLAVFKLIPVTLTLAGIAGLILSIGMAVDANVLIFERMKEELRLGRTLSSAIEIGFSRAWPAIRDSNVSTIITSVILIWFGQRLGATLLAGFGTALVIGVLLSMFSALFISKTLLNLLAATALGRRRSWYTPESPRSALRPEVVTESQEGRT